MEIIGKIAYLSYEYAVGIFYISDTRGMIRDLVVYTYSSVAYARMYSSTAQALKSYQGIVERTVFMGGNNSLYMYIFG